MEKLEDDLKETLKTEDDAKTIKRVINHLKNESLPTKVADTTNKVDTEMVLNDLDTRAEKERRWTGLTGKLSDLAETPLNSGHSNTNEFTSEESKIFERPLHKEGADLTDIEDKTKSIVDKIDDRTVRKKEKVNELIDRMARGLDDDPTMGE